MKLQPSLASGTVHCGTAPTLSAHAQQTAFDSRHFGVNFRACCSSAPRACASAQRGCVASRRASETSASGARAGGWVRGVGCASGIARGLHACDSAPGIERGCVIRGCSCLRIEHGCMRRTRSTTCSAVCSTR